MSLGLEKRLTAPPWLAVAVPAGSLLTAFVIGGVILAVSGHDPFSTLSNLITQGFTDSGALTSMLQTGTPLMFTGLAAAAAFRMGVFNIGGEGQLYVGAMAGSGIGLALGDQATLVIVVAMVLAAALAGAAWAALPGVLKAVTGTSELITSLMLNYVGGLLISYLIFDSGSYWRDLSPTARTFPQGKTLSDAASWPSVTVQSVTLPLGLALGLLACGAVWLLHRHTRFGYEARVAGDSPPAARYAGISRRRKIVALMMISGAIAALGGASQIGDFGHVLDPKGLEQQALGYTGIVVAALARFNPLAVPIVAMTIGGLTNAGFALEGPDFPSGLVGILQGALVLCALAGTVLGQYRIRRAAT